MTEQEARNAVCAQAREWLGYNGADGSHRAMIDLYNANRPTGSYKMTYTDPWCAAFVSAVGMAVGLGDVLLPEVSCDRMIALYQKAGRWIEDDAYCPRPGDLIFYDWQDSGAGDCTGAADHVGIVINVDGKSVTVIEGNYSDAVKRRTVPLNGRYIRGFAVPDYGKQTEETWEAGEDPSTPADASAQDDTEGGNASAQDDTEGNASARCVALPELRFGDTGLPVRAMQGVLIARGYSCGPDGADGDFGYNTLRALRRFQAAEGLTADGVAGGATWARLLGGAVRE